MSSRDRRRKYSDAQLKQIRAEKAAKLKEKESFKWHWSLTIFLIGIVLGIFSFAWLTSAVVISVIEIITIIIIIAATSAPLQYKYFKNHNKIAETMKKALPFYIAYNIFGIGFIGFFTFITLNISLASDEIVHEYYEVVGMDPEYKLFRYGSVVFLLEDDVFSSDVDLRALPFKNYSQLKTKPVMEYDFKKGFLGYKIIVDHRLVESKPKDE